MVSLLYKNNAASAQLALGSQASRQAREHHGVHQVTLSAMRITPPVLLLASSLAVTPAHRGCSRDRAQAYRGRVAAGP